MAEEGPGCIWFVLESSTCLFVCLLANISFEDLKLFSLLQILTAGTKPSAPAWGGIGDFDVVRSEWSYLMGF